MRKADMTLTPKQARQITVGSRGEAVRQRAPSPSAPHPEVTASHAISRAGGLHIAPARARTPSKSRSQSPDGKRSKLARAQSPQPQRARVVEVEAISDATATGRDDEAGTSGAGAAAEITPKQRANVFLASIPAKTTAGPKLR